MNKLEIGLAVDSLPNDVRRNAANLVRQYRRRGLVELLRQAVDTPSRARAQFAAWISEYNARNGAGTAQTFLAECLVAAASPTTLAQINSDLAAIEMAAQAIVTRVTNDGWTWEQVAVAAEAAFASAIIESFDYSRLPIPAGYRTVWGDPW
jgi:hypothetical protein